MLAKELKSLLIDRIKQINDEHFLHALKILTDSKMEKDVYLLSDFDKNKINQAKQEDKFIDHKAAMEDIDQWLKE